MSGKVGVLTVDLVAKTGGFIAGLDKADSKTKKFQKNSVQAFDEVAKTALKASAAMGATYAASIAALTKKGVDAVASQSRLSQSLNTSYNSITQLNLAFADKGIDGYEASLNRLNRRLGAAELGRGAAYKSVKELNLNLKELSKLDAAERLAVIADRIKEVSANSQIAARYAQDLGFEQREAAAFFLQGGDAIRQAGEAVDRLGLSLSDLQAQKVEEAAQSMGVYGDVLAVVSQNLAAEFAPAILKANEAFTDFVEAAGGAEGITKSVISTLKDAQDVAAVLGMAVAARLTAPLLSNAIAFTAAQVEAVRYQAALASMAGVSTTTAVSLTGLGVAARAARSAMALVGGPSGAAILAAGAITYFASKSKDASGETENLRKQIDSLSQSYEKISKLQAAADIHDTNRAIVAQEKELNLLNAQLEYAQVNAKKFQSTDFSGATITKLIDPSEVEKIDRLSFAVEKAQSELEGLKDKKVNLENIISGNIGNKLDDINDATDKLSELGKTYLEIKATLDPATAAQEKYKKIADEIANSQATQAEKTELLRLAALEYNDALISINNKSEQSNKELGDSYLDLLGKYDAGVAAFQTYAREIEQIEEAQISLEQQTQLMALALDKYNKAILEPVEQGYWERWLEGAEAALNSFEELSSTVINSFQTQFANAFEEMLLDSKNLEDALKDMTKAVARAFINAVGQMIAQWLAFKAVQLLTGKQAQASAATAIISNATAGVMTAGINAFSSTAAIPIVGPAAAPAAMAAAIATTSPLAVAAGNAALAGMAHDGIDNIPYEGTWLLDKGERVVDSRTNEDLKSFLKEDGSGGSGGNVIVNIHADKERAGQVEESVDDEEQMVIDIFVSDIMSDGQSATAIRRKFGLTPQGI